MNATVAPRWGRQSSLIQPRQPAFWLYCGMLAIGGYLFYQEQSLMSTMTTAYALSWALVLAYAIPVALTIYWLDLFEREPKLMLAAAVIWGGVIATSLAAYANEAWLSVLGKFASPDLTSQWGAAIVGPSVEETLKLMGVVTLFLIAPSEFDGVMDGFVYGAMVGLGFTVVEDVSYFINAVAAVPGAVDQSGPVLDTFLIRVVGGGLYGHVLFTGLTGTGFAYFVTQRAAPIPKRLLGAGLCIVAGLSAHVVWNSPWMESVLQTSGGGNPSVMQWIEYGTLKGMPFLILLGILVALATRSEEDNFRRIVAGEPDPTVVTEDEVRSLRSLWARRSARLAAGRLRGRAGRRLTGQLQAAQVRYALIRSRSDSLTDPALEAVRIKIRSIRSELAASPVLSMPSQTPMTMTLTGPASMPGIPSGPAPMPAPEPAAAAPGPIAASVAVADAGGAFDAAPARDATRAPSAAPIEPAPAQALAAPAPISPVPAAPAPAWIPTHVVPAGGLPAWQAPDPTRQPLAVLSERVELVVVSRAGAWAQVRGVNGWTGWVDGRLLVERR